MQQIWHLGTPLGGYRPMSYIFRKLFSETTFQSRIVGLCPGLFKSDRASNLTILKKSLYINSTDTCIADTPGGYCPMPYIFRKIFLRATFASQIVCLYLASFRSYRASKMTIIKSVDRTMQFIYNFLYSSSHGSKENIVN